MAAPFNSVIENIAQHPQWLLDTLATVEHEDKEFTGRLIELMREVMSTGGEKQPIHLGVHRSDYMINISKRDKTVGLLQVELNTIASSFGSLSSRITSMHKYTLKHNIPKVLGTLPGNESLKSIAHALCFAHQEYMKVRMSNSKEELNAMWNKMGLNKPSTASSSSSGSPQTHEVKIMFVVQPNERNVMDQRLLEYEIANQSSDRTHEANGSISCIRATLAEIDSRCNVTSNGTLFFDNHEISVVYFRAG
jgi:glutathione synthase